MRRVLLTVFILVCLSFFSFTREDKEIKSIKDAKSTGFNKTIQSFIESEYAKGLSLKPSMSKPGVHAYFGKGKEVIFLKTQNDLIYSERLTWLSSAMPTDENVRQKAYIQFLMQAVEIQTGTPEYDQLVQNVKGNVAEFTLKGIFSVQLKKEETPTGPKYYVEVFTK